MLPPDVVAKMSRKIAAEQSPDIEVAGVVWTEGGSDHVEVLITIKGCHREPCRFLINLSRRADEAALEQELRNKFRDVLTAHAKAATS